MLDNGFVSWNAERKKLDRNLDDAYIFSSKGETRVEILLYRLVNALEGIRCELENKSTPAMEATAGSLDMLNGTMNVVKEAAWRTIDRMDAIIQNTDELAEAAQK